MTGSQTALEECLGGGASRVAFQSVGRRHVSRRFSCRVPPCVGPFGRRRVSRRFSSRVPSRVGPFAEKPTVSYSRMNPQKKPIPEDRLFLFQTIPSTYFFRRIPTPSPAASTRRSHPAGSGTFVSTPGPTGGMIGGTFGSSGSIASPR